MGISARGLFVPPLAQIERAADVPEMDAGFGHGPSKSEYTRIVRQRHDFVKCRVGRAAMVPSDPRAVGRAGFSSVA
jgi:hypothetical protein